MNSEQITWKLAFPQSTYAHTHTSPNKAFSNYFLILNKNFYNKKILFENLFFKQNKNLFTKPILFVKYKHTQHWKKEDNSKIPLKLWEKNHVHKTSRKITFIDKQTKRDGKIKKIDFSLYN